MKEPEFLLPAGQIPNGATVRKAIGGKAYKLVSGMALRAFLPEQPRGSEPASVHLKASEGTKFLRDLNPDGETVQLYSVATDKLLLWVMDSHDLDVWAYRRDNPDWDK